MSSSSSIRRIENITITAHTCWPYLEIPNRIQSREELYAELLRSCTSTDFGFA